MTLIAGCGRSGSVSSGCGQSRRRRACLTTPTGTTGVRVREQAPGTRGSALPTARGGGLGTCPHGRGGRLREPREACVCGYTFLPPEDRAVSGSRPAGPFRDLPPNTPRPSARGSSRAPRAASRSTSDKQGRDRSPTPESVHGPPFLALEQTFFPNSVTSPWKLSRQTSAPDRLGEYYRHV